MNTPQQPNCQDFARAVLPMPVCPCGTADIEDRGSVHNSNLRTHHNQIVKPLLARVRGRGFQLKGPPL